MGLRMPTFKCSNGHRGDVLVNDDVTSISCSCGATAYKQAGAPSVKSAERVSRNEVRQFMAQFGEFNRDGSPKWVPKNREELNIALKEKGQVAVSDREFRDLLEKPKPEPAAPTPQQKAATVDFIKARRQKFRSDYDNGAIAKVEAPADVVAAAKSEVAGD